MIAYERAEPTGPAPERPSGPRFSNRTWMLVFGAIVVIGGGTWAYLEDQSFQVARQYIEALTLCSRDEAAGRALIAELDEIHGDRGRAMFPPEMNERLANCGPLSPLEMMDDFERLLEQVQ